MTSAEFSPEKKKILKSLFLLLFLDIVGFSIIFPLFPQLAHYYLTYDSGNVFLTSLFNWINSLTFSNDHYSIVLFGGILGGLYSFLQFIFAPVWGGISDRIGRRPVLLICITGLALSYLMWGFAGSFTLLLISRILGGVMSGNISTATAVVSDITNKEERSKGMAIIGISFALGFICGPAIGGGLSLINLNSSMKSSFIGLNPFSVPAFFSFFLSVLNLFLLYKNFPETKKSGEKLQRTNNILKLFKPLPHKGVNSTNFAHFFFLTAFSGMEFTLTFLAYQRLKFQAYENAMMFVFVGFVLAMVQGGFVRRRASQIGEKKVATLGLVLMLPGFFILKDASSVFTLYLALGILATGSAMIIPCLTALVSLYGPSEEQGRLLGMFRSLGALSRVVGPLSAAIMYWALGANTTYLVLGIFMILPLLMVSRLPKVS